MSEMERQVRGFWARVMEWLRGPRGTAAAQRARNALDDVRTSDVGRKAESALKDLRDGDAGRKAKEAIRDLKDSDTVGKARDAAKDVLRDLKDSAGRRDKA